MRASALTHQVHPGGGVTEGHADPGGCVSDDLMIHTRILFSLRGRAAGAKGTPARELAGGAGQP